MKKLLAAIIMVVLPFPAFAAIQNVKVSGSIDSYYVNRSNFDFKPSTNGTDAKYHQSFFYTSSHLLVSSDLSDNVSAQVGLVNEIPWGDVNVSNSTSGGGTVSNSSDQNVDIELANVTLREFLYSPLTVTIGRQVLSYGNDFIIGAGGGVSAGDMANVAADMSRTLNYDGIRAVLDYKPLTIDAVYVKTNSRNLTGGTTDTNLSNNNDDQNLYGVVANYQLNDPMGTVVEGSFWSRTDNGAHNVLGGKSNTLYVPDLRVSTNPIKGLNVQGEIATEMGHTYNPAISLANDRNEKISKAWAAQGRVSYTLPVLEKYKPTVSEVFSYYSGDNLKSATKANGWVTMYNDQDLGTTIWRALFNPTNLFTNELSLSVSPLEDVTAKFTWTDLWLADTYGTGNFTGSTIFTAGLPDASALPTYTLKDNRGLGNEFDGVISYQYTEDVSFGLNLGYFKPGSVFASRNSTAAEQAIASVGVNF